MKFSVNPKIFNQFNKLQVGVIVCHNINNKVIDPQIQTMYNNVSVQVRTKFAGMDELASYPIINQWRNVYKSFGEKKCKSSVEALIRRVSNGHVIPSINGLVDLYNIISLKYEIPCGGEDLKQITNDIELTYATGTEQFKSLNSDIIETVNANEIVYKFDQTVICRNFNYRESDITKLSEDTTDCVLVIENIGGDLNHLNQALNELASLVKQYLHATCDIHILDDKQTSFEIK